MTRFIAAILAIVLLPLSARADTPPDPVFTSQTPPPESFSPLRWGDKPGFWYSQDQVLRIQGRMDYLEQRAAKECVDAQVDSKSARVPGWIWVTLGIVVGGTAGYFGSRAVK